MNSLNLRISSIKTGENIKKKSDLRSELLIVPSEVVQDINLTCNDIDDLKNAPTVPDQVFVVKQIFMKHENDENYLQFLSNLLFYAPIKHPIRNQLTKLFQQTKQEKQSDIKKILSNSLRNLLPKRENISTLRCAALNKNIISLAGCFDNFPISKDSFKENLSPIFSFLCISFEKYLDEIRTSILSPSDKNELYSYLHNDIRLLLLMIQEFPMLLISDHREKLNNLTKLCNIVMEDSDIPMDTKTNCGILTVYIKHHENEYNCLFEYIIMPHNEYLTFSDCFQLCICTGLINVLKENNYYLKNYQKQFVIVTKKIIQIANSHSTEPSLLLASTRLLFQFSKIQLSVPKELLNEYETIRKILQLMTDYIFNYIENYMDSIRHLCKDLLRNVLKLQEKFQFIDDIKMILEICSSKEITTSVQCQFLICISQVYGTNYILNHLPMLVENFLLTKIGLDLNSNNCYEFLMIANYHEIDFHTWTDRWILPLLKLSIQIKQTTCIYYDADVNNRLQIIQNFINKSLIKCNPDILYYIIDNYESNNGAIPLSICLSALWTLRRNNEDLKVANFNEIFEKFSENFQYTILSNCDEMKVTTLRLLIETHKTTEFLTNIECDNILLYLRYNSNCQIPATRQKCLDLITKGLKRLDLCLQKLIKNEQTQLSQSLIKLYKNFLKSLTQILFENLFDGANFSRRSISLNLLQKLLQVLINNKLNIQKYLPKIAPEEILFKCLQDSYEMNKNLALQIMTTIDNYLKRKWYHHLNLEIIQELMISIKPMDSVTSAYYLEYFCNQLSVNTAKEYFLTTDCCSNDELPTYAQVIYCALHWCLNILNDGIIIAEKSIVLAAKLNPLYGSLFTIRHFIKKLSFEELANNDVNNCWKNFLYKIIKICKKLTNIVGPIVNSSSPEGHLPNDFSDIPVDYLKFEQDSAELSGNCYSIKILSTKKSNDFIQKNCKVTSQMILLCSWRTIKEVSLILGEIVSQSIVRQHQQIEVIDKYVISQQDILDIGEHFKELLSETKHRGAFEQAYIGFLKVCCRLWTALNNDLNQLPMKWLRELILIISSDECLNEKICATRRSAGVPFMVQAIIIAELQVGTLKSLHLCMKKLIMVCENTNSSVESRTHALNILRALYRCTDLGEAVAEYVSDGIQCAIRSYAADTWAERNSATLLFSALITRVFGVQKTKDSENLNIRNKMTGRIFFLRYPKLYDFLLNGLHDACAEIENNKKANKLHPLLLILSRLYPSALEGTESNLKLSAFVPYICACSKSPVLQTRVLAAQAVVAFIPFDIITQQIDEILLKIKDYSKAKSKTMDANVIHGYFLQVFYLLRSVKTLKNTEMYLILPKILDIVMEICPNAVIMREILNIFIYIFNRMPNPEESKDLVTSVELLMHSLNRLESKYSMCYTDFRKSLFIFNFQQLSIQYGLSSKEVFTLICNQLSKSENSVHLIEQTKTCLNLLLLIFTSKHFNLIENEFGVSKQEIEFIKSQNTQNLQQIIFKLQKDDCFYRNLIFIAKDKYFYPECSSLAYTLLSYIIEFHHTDDKILQLNELIDEGNQYPDDEKHSISACIEKVVRIKVEQNKITKYDQKLILNYLKEISQPWSSYLLRLSASGILIEISKIFDLEINKENTDFVANFTSITLQLLFDDDFDIRSRISKMILNNILHEFSNGEVFCLFYNVIEIYAMEIYLKNLAKSLEKWSEYELYSVIKNILKEFINEINYGNSNDATNYSNCNNVDDLDEIFDKNEANIFAETKFIEINFIEIFLKHFHENHKSKIYNVLLEHKDNYL